MGKRKAYLIYCGVLCLLAVILASCGQQTHHVEKPFKKERASTSVSSSALPTPTSVVEDVPVRLIIPAIQVDAQIEPVGVLASGDLDTPRQQPWSDVGWYSASPDPGKQGSAVIDGHLDRPGGLPAVFWNLRNLKASDELRVVYRSGKTALFSVTRIMAYPLQDIPLQEIFGKGGGSYLNLITCAGDWIASQHQTTLRMVVYAMLVK